MPSWLSSLQKKSQKQKIRLLYTIVGICAIVLIIVWAIAGHYSAQPDRVDTSFFQTVGQSFKNLSNYYKK